MVALPFLLINNSFAISYNNLIPENYISPYTGIHIRRLYLSDYTLCLPAYFASLLKNEQNLVRKNKKDLATANKNLKTIAKNLVQTNEFISNFIDKEEFSVDDVERIIIAKQEETVMTLKKEGFEVHLIKMKDFSIDDHSASGLHCRTKIIERDYIM